ncbi:F-box protein [Cardamine amara subsp. amara]|uniref:F-box protein n=1 Tax=Cardamine amara subsp. amara TaxID=228776 RepID=A0ABD0ZL30_CARAN
MENLGHQVMDLTIPHDLLIDILSRNPAKSIARSRCVSKIWKSILLSPNFTELFLRRSLSRPRLLFTFFEDESLFFFSSPQPQNLDENTSLVAVADHHTYFQHVSFGICLPINGLICTQDRGWRYSVPVICNPSTGESITLPVLELDRADEKRYFGYDPIDKKFKVLCVSCPSVGTSNLYEEHHVLTLETGELSWRKIECCLPYYLLYNYGICIDGVLYYPAATNIYEDVSIIVCFDVRSEKFSFVNKPEGLELGHYSTLVNYKGKLSALQSKRGIDYNEIIDGSMGFLKLWVLVDHEKHIWSMKIYQIPSMWRTVIQKTDVYFAGITSSGEFVLSPYSSNEPFYLFFYDPEKITIVRVEIQGIDQRLRNRKVYTFIEYIEDVKL